VLEQSESGQEAEQVEMTLSVGIASRQLGDGEDARALLRRAHKALVGSQTEWRRRLGRLAHSQGRIAAASVSYPPLPMLAGSGVPAATPWQLQATRRRELLGL